MKPFKAHKKKEDADYITAESETGTKVLDGVQCPRCGLMFAVIASVNGDEWRAVPPDGSVDYFCPACGENLKPRILNAK